MCVCRLEGVWRGTIKEHAYHGIEVLLEDGHAEVVASRVDHNATVVEARKVGNDGLGGLGGEGRRVSMSWWELL